MKATTPVGRIPFRYVETRREWSILSLNMATSFMVFISMIAFVLIAFALRPQSHPMQVLQLSQFMSPEVSFRCCCSSYIVEILVVWHR
jgi:hypothetical protein